MKRSGNQHAAIISSMQIQQEFFNRIGRFLPVWKLGLRQLERLASAKLDICLSSSWWRHSQCGDILGASSPNSTSMPCWWMRP